MGYILPVYSKPRRHRLCMPFVWLYKCSWDKTIGYRFSFLIVSLASHSLVGQYFNANYKLSVWTCSSSLCVSFFLSSSPISPLRRNKVHIHVRLVKYLKWLFLSLSLSVFWGVCVQTLFLPAQSRTYRWPLWRIILRVNRDEGRDIKWLYITSRTQWRSDWWRTKW